MTEESLVLFMKRLLEYGSVPKTVTSLIQLKQILEMQNARQELVDLVQKTIVSLPEAKKAAMEDSFSEESLKIAIRRAEERKIREAEIASRGRC